MDDVDERVRDIADRLLSGKFGRLEQLRYAEEWGVSHSTVKSWTAQAARVLRFMRGDTEEYRERLLANLENAGRIALELKRTWISKDGESFDTEAPDVKAYISAQAEQAKLLRLDKPERDDGTEAIDVEQLAAALRALGHEVKLNEAPDSSTISARPEARGTAGAATERAPASPADSSDPDED